MSEVVSIQLSIFCNKHVEPTAKKVQDLMQVFQKECSMEFLPNIMNGQLLDVSANQIMKVQNLSFFTSDQKYRILYTDNRIDVVFSATKGATELTIDQDIKKSGLVMRTVMEQDSIDANRMAVILGVIGNNGVDDFSAFAIQRGLKTPLSYYNEKRIEEWMTRYHTKTIISIGDKNEEINVGTDLSLISKLGATKKYIFCNIDINTLAENNSLRFTNHSIEAFVDAIHPTIAEIKNSFEGFDNDDTI